MTTLSGCKSLNELNNFLQGVDHTTIGKAGGRKIVDDQGKEYAVSQVSKKFIDLCKKSDYSKKESKCASTIADKIITLENDQEYKKGLTNQKKTTNLKIRRALGNLKGKKYKTAEELKAKAFSCMLSKFRNEYRKLGYDSVPHLFSRSDNLRDRDRAFVKMLDKRKDIIVASKNLHEAGIEPILKYTKIIFTDEDFSDVKFKKSFTVTRLHPPIR